MRGRIGDLHASTVVSRASFFEDGDFAMFKSFWGSEGQENQLPAQSTRNESVYPPSVTSSSPTSRLPTPGSSYAQGLVDILKDKSVDELRKLLNDKDAYDMFFNSLDQVKQQNELRDELRRETIKLARENLGKEPRILELRNQCRIIRTSELAAAQEKLGELEHRKEKTLKFYDRSTLLKRLEDAIKETEDESISLERQFHANEIDLTTFIQKYKKQRNIYQKRKLLHLAAQTSTT